MGKARKKPSSGAFKRLRGLYCFDEMDKKVKAGVSVEEIARWLQEDLMQLPEVKRETLVRQLYRYKASLPPGQIVTAPPLYLKRAIEKLRRGVNEIEELEHLYLFQLKRISIDAETEEKINKLFSGTGREIQLAADLLTRMMDKKMELGLMDKQPEKLEISGGMQVTGDSTDEDTRHRLGLAAGKLVDLLQANLEQKDEEEDKNE